MAPGETGLLTRNPWVVRRALTVADYHRMGEAGILTRQDRVELIEGELIALSPIGSGHSGTVNALTRMLVQLVGDRYTSVSHVGRDGALEPALLPGVTIPVGTLLG
jgi:hypothetical protein